MFNIGFWEMALIGLIALMVVGPQKLPDLARQAGSWIGKAKRFVDSARSDIEREFRADELKRALNEQQDEIRRLEGMISETKADLQEVGASRPDADKPVATRAPEAGKPAPAQDPPDRLSADDGAERLTRG